MVSLGEETIYLDTSKCLHPLIQVDDPISPDINKIEKILDNRETGNWLRGELAQTYNKFIELIKSHSSSIILIELEKLLKNSTQGKREERHLLGWA